MFGILFSSPDGLYLDRKQDAYAVVCCNGAHSPSEWWLAAWRDPWDSTFVHRPLISPTLPIS